MSVNWTLRTIGVIAALGAGWVAGVPSSAQTPPAAAQPPAAAPQSPGPCAGKPQYTHLDFWVGEWDVTRNGQPVATSSIQRMLGGCVILEHYAQPDGYSGRSFNYVDGVAGRWRQTWVDSAGNVSEFVGALKDQTMHFEGATHRQDGQKILRKMTLSSLGPDRVRQYSERSNDGGKTWDVAYDLLYLRKK